MNTPMYLIAAGTDVWSYLGPILAGCGGLLVGGATMLSRGDQAKSDKVDYHNRLLEAMQAHLTYMSKENESQRDRIDELDRQVRKCQNDKYEMNNKLTEWERKWEERLGGTEST